MRKVGGDLEVAFIFIGAVRAGHSSYGSSIGQSARFGVFWGSDFSRRNTESPPNCNESRAARDSNAITAAAIPLSRLRASFAWGLADRRVCPYRVPENYDLRRHHPHALSRDVSRAARQFLAAGPRGSAEGKWACETVQIRDFANRQTRAPSMIYARRRRGRGWCSSGDVRLLRGALDSVQKPLPLEREAKLMAQRQRVGDGGFGDSKVALPPEAGAPTPSIPSPRRRGGRRPILRHDAAGQAHHPTAHSAIPRPKAPRRHHPVRAVSRGLTERLFEAPPRDRTGFALPTIVASL